MSTSSDKQAAAFKQYIGDKKIVIADESAVARQSLTVNLIQMGAKSTNITLASSFQDAEQEIARVHPHLVICDYDLNGGSGLELLQRQRLQFPDAKDSIFILVTGNSSQSAVARAAEEDVDNFILKPFSPTMLRVQIAKAVLSKMQPDTYTMLINKGKELVGAGSLDEAMKVFEDAKTQNPAPALACFYIGQVNLLKQAMDQAEGRFNEGLNYNKIHYKCLVGLYDLMHTQKKYAEAYEVVKRISQYFPANPQRLSAVLKLAIMTKSYDDVEKYYQIFTKIDVRSEEIIKHVCAALVVCGKYYLQNGHHSRALELFNKAAVTASGRTRVLAEIIFALCSEGKAKEAEKFLKRFPPDTTTQPLFLSVEYLVMDRLEIPRSAIVERGRQLIAQDVHEPLIYEILIKRSVEARLRPAAESLLDEAKKRWPDQVEKFEKALNGAAGETKKT